MAKYRKKPVIVDAIQFLDTAERIAEIGEFYPCKPDIFAETYEEVPANREG
jgi:hypothetical protein